MMRGVDGGGIELVRGFTPFKLRLFSVSFHTPE